MINFFRFIFSKWFLINAGIALLLFIIGFLVINQRLKVYTHHGEAIAIPDFRGLPSDSLAGAIEEYHFRMKIIDSLYDEQMKPGAVIQQNPEPGTRVKENRTIYFTVNMHQPPNVLVPAMANQSSRQVEATLKILGLKIKEKKYEPSPYENLVLDILYNGESIDEGAEIPLNSELVLVIGTNNNLPWVALPDLRNMKPANADSLLMNAGLNLGQMVDCNGCYSGKDSARAVIYRTNPQYKPDKKVRLGSSIDYWISPEPLDSIQVN